MQGGGTWANLGLGLSGRNRMAKRKRKKTKSKKKSSRSQGARKRWSQRVTEESHALALEEGVFTLDSPQAIAASLKRSADESTERKSEPFRSAMSMLVFYINRAGKGLSEARKAKLEKAKDELRRLYGKD